MTTIKATVRGGRLELERPIDLPDGTELFIPLPDAVDEDGPMSPEEIARVLTAMDQMTPFEMTPEEEAEIESRRQRQKEWEKTHFAERAENLRRMWE
jgi:hypothetical protein